MPPKHSSETKHGPKNLPIFGPENLRIYGPEYLPVFGSERLPIFGPEQKTECKEVKNLIGPIELDILDHPTTGVRIVLLGDVHVNQKRCPSKERCGVPIFLYLQQLFQQYTGSEFLDFFLEIPFTDDFETRGDMWFPTTRKKLKAQIITGEVYETFIHSLMVFFYECFQKSKKQCEFYNNPYIRFHYSDVRGGVIHSESEDESIEVINQLRAIKTEVPKEKHVKFLLSVIKRFQDGDIDYFFKLSKIDKQFKRLKMDDKDSFVRNLRILMIVHMQDKEIFADILREKAEQILAEMKQSRDPLDGKRFIELYYLVIGSLLSPLFDIYTLARIFRFRMKQVIIYAGQIHTDRIKQFLLNEMGFKQTVSRRSDDKGSNFQCIDMKNVPQPWFP